MPVIAPSGSFELADRRHVAFGVLEVGDGANGRDPEFLGDHLAAVAFNGADRLVWVLDDERALESDHAAAGNQFAALLQQPATPVIGILSSAAQQILLSPLERSDRPTLGVGWLRTLGLHKG